MNLPQDPKSDPARRSRGPIGPEPSMAVSPPSVLMRYNARVLDPTSAVKIAGPAAHPSHGVRGGSAHRQRQRRRQHADRAAAMPPSATA